MADLCDGWGQPVGCYASALEAEWADWFRRAGWPHRYAGQGRPWADFELLPAGLAPLLVEVKPGGDRFLEQAIQRLVGHAGDALVLQGSPRCAVWTYVRRADAVTWARRDAWPAYFEFCCANPRSTSAAGRLTRFVAALRAPAELPAGVAELAEALI
jgi:hypothetical protein